MAEDAKSKNAKTIKKQTKVEEKITEEPVVIDSTEAANKLSKRSEDYLYKLRKELVAGGKTDEEAQTITDGLIPEIVENQIKGIPATKLYGTPTQKVEELLNTKKTQSQGITGQPYWKIVTDSALLFLSLFSLMYGVLGMSGSSRNGQTGVVTLFGIAIIWGIMLPWFNMQNRKPKEERPKLLVLMGYILAGLLIMMALLFLTALLPAVINPVLSGITYLVIAAVAFGGRYLFRRQNHITGSTMF